MLLERYARALEPLRVRHGLEAYTITPGFRLRRLWGRCQFFPSSPRPAEIVVRCTIDGDSARWRRPGAIVATLLHEMAHLKYRGHGPRFWALHRRLLDEAALLGIYDPLQDDPHEPSRGAEKLAGSAAHAQAEAARTRRRERSAHNRTAARTWDVGDVGVVDVPRGHLAGAHVRVLSVARSWLTVETAQGSRFRVAAGMLKRPGTGCA